MKTNQAPTNERLLQMLSEEKNKFGEFTYTDRRKAVEEMLRMRNVKF